MIEKEFDQMLEDLNSVNDEFIGDYFNDVEDTVKEEKIEENPEELNEESVEEATSEEDKEESEVGVKEEEKPQVYQNHFTSFSKTNINKIGSKKIKVYHQNNFEKDEKEEPVKEEPKKTFSYSEILNRLDQEKKYDLNNVNDLMKFIDKCETSEQFFDYVESERNDK